MSKSSGTNSPKASEENKILIILSFEIYNGGNSDGDPPLPIPNREVKPVCADGTAIPSGRVGNRQLLKTCKFSYRSFLFIYMITMFKCF